MPIFSSVEEAQEAHKNYHIDTDQEGKYRNDPENRGRLRVEWLVNNTPEGAYTLEVGCNSGGLCKRIQDERKAYVKGVDICEYLVARANAKGVSAQVAKAEELPFRDNTFECVIMTEVMEHLYDPNIVLKEIYRVLKPEGIFLGSVPHPDGENSNKKPLEEHHYHCHIFEPKEIEELLNNNHFSYVDLDYIHHTEDFTNVKQWTVWKGVKA